MDATRSVRGAVATRRHVAAGVRGAGLMLMLMAALCGLAGGPAAAAAFGGGAAPRASHHRRHPAKRPSRRPHRPAPVRAPTGSALGVPAGCAGTDREPDAASVAAVAQATICLVNRERVARGLTALVERAALDRAAEYHSQEMVAENYFDHVSPTGETLAERVLPTGYVPPGSAWTLGENLASAATGAASPAAIVAAWMSDPGHRANILDPSYRDTGVGVVAEMPAALGAGRAGATYTQAFGTVGVG